MCYDYGNHSLNSREICVKRDMSHVGACLCTTSSYMRVGAHTLVDMCVCVYVCMCLCVCVCVYVCEREKEKKQERKRGRECVYVCLSVWVGG